MSFEQPKSAVDVIREKLANKSDKELGEFIADPIDVISTNAPGEESPWNAVSEDEIKALAQEEMDRRSA